MSDRRFPQSEPPSVRSTQPFSQGRILLLYMACSLAGLGFLIMLIALLAYWRTSPPVLGRIYTVLVLGTSLALVALGFLIAFGRHLLQESFGALAKSPKQVRFLVLLGWFVWFGATLILGFWRYPYFVLPGFIGGQICVLLALLLIVALAHGWDVVDQWTRFNNWLPGLELRFWIPALLIFVSLLYSTSLHLVYFSEHTLGVGYFFTDYPIAEDERYTMFADVGTLSASSLELDAANLWKFSTFWGDAGFYLAQVEDFTLAFAPYKYRLVPTLLVRAIVIGAAFLKVDLPPYLAYVVINVVSTLLVGMGFTRYLRIFHHFQRHLTLVGGLLAVTSLTIMRTLPFPMPDPLSMLAALWLFWALQRRSDLGFMLASAFAVWTKEIFIIATPLWLVLAYYERPWIRWRNLRHLLIATVPLLVFMGTRLLMGGAALEVNYGYDVLAGEFPRYGQRLLTPDGRMELLKRTFLAFGFLWLGIFQLRRDRFLMRCFWVSVPLTLFATYLLSSQVIRVLGILYPVIVPLFLFYFVPPESRSEALSAAVLERDLQ